MGASQRARLRRSAKVKVELMSLSIYQNKGASLNQWPRLAEGCFLYEIGLLSRQTCLSSYF
jgi:hypothetical protein